MKNINKYILVSIIALATLFTACEKEVLVPVEESAAVDSLLADLSDLDDLSYDYNLEMQTVTITNQELSDKIAELRTERDNARGWSGDVREQTNVQYTVSVLSAANYLQGRVSGISGATVSVRQGNYFETQETESGLAVFSGLKEGEAVVRISADEHTEVLMTVDFLTDGSYSSDADYYNAATQVLLFPVSGNSLATIGGRLMANTSTLNDTLGRRYDAGSGDYISRPGVREGVNYTGDYINTVGTIYSDYPAGRAVQYEQVSEDLRLYAVALPTNLQFNNGNDAGYITSISYSDMVYEATVEGDSYSVSVPVSVGQGNLSLSFETSDLIADFTRFTEEDSDFSSTYGIGTANEAGSEPNSFRYFNNSNNAVQVYTLAEEGSWVTVEPNTSVEIERRTIIEKRRYQILGGADDFDSDKLKPGKVVLNHNLYLWPTYFRGEGDI